MPLLWRILSLLALALCALLGGLLRAPMPLAAAQTSRSLKIEDFYLYPDDRTEKSSSDFSFPDERRINAVVRVSAEGFKGEENLTVFLVIFDSKEKVLDKKKARFKLPAGRHDLVLNDILLTDEAMGEQDLSCKVEVTLKGALPAHEERAFTVSGPEPPRVEIRDLLIYNPSLGRQSSTFDPGDNFEFEASIEIADNPARMAPTLIIYAAMDEDFYDTDPHEGYQPFNEQWDRLKLSTAKDGGVEGLYKVKASGRVPRFYAQPYETHHDLRIYAIIDWGVPEPGKISDQAIEDYAEAEIVDFYPGEARSSQELQDRLVELNRAYTWEVKRVRGDLPGED